MQEKEANNKKRKKQWVYMFPGESGRERNWVEKAGAASN